jgi:hypothetical protein
MDNAHCVCQQGDQTADHPVYDCNLLETQREILRKNVTKKGQWPEDKHELTTHHLEPLLTYTESIDLDRLQKMMHAIQFTTTLVLINKREKCSVVNNRK